MEQKRRIALSLPIFLMAFALIYFFIDRLPLWAQLMAALIIAIIAVSLIPGPPASQLIQPQGAPAPQSRWVSAGFGIVGLFIGLAILGLIIGSLWVLISVIFFSPPDVVYGAGDLAKFGTNCQINASYVGGANCKIDVGRLTDSNWKKIEIVQPGFNEPGGPAEIEAMTVNIGSWSFDHRIGTGQYLQRPNMRLVTITYGGKSVNPGYGELTREGFSPYIFTISKSWNEVEVSLDDGTRGGNKVLASSKVSVVGVPIEGMLTIKGNIRDKEVRIYNSFSIGNIPGRVMKVLGL